MDQTGIFYYLCLLSLPLLALFLGIFCWLLYSRWESGFMEMRQEVDYLARKLRSLEKPGDTRRCSDNQLDKTELIARFENIGAMEIKVPEKYRHVAHLEQSGLGVRELSEILDVSRNEAEQMLALVRSSREG